MIETLKNAWKIPDLRKKLLFTLMMIIVFRFGSVIPVPGIDAESMRNFLNQSEGSIFGLMDLFSGGAFANATIFAMGISPYINSSIIMQLLTVAIPALERLQKEGEEGRKKIASITRIVTIALALIQAVGLYFLMNNQGIIKANAKGFWMAFIIVTTLTAGTAFVMWLGEQITEKGIGNGISLMIFAGIVARLPHTYKSLFNNFKTSPLMLILIVLVSVGLITFVVLVDSSERKIPVQYAKRVVGRKMYGGQSTHIPLKVAMAGVIPIIFAMSILTFPSTMVQLFTGQTDPSKMGAIAAWITNVFSRQSWGYAILYFLLIIGFTYFYTAITFNPIEVSNNMKKNGGFVPGIRPGKPTSDFIAKVLSRLNIAGATFLGIIAVFPIILGILNTNLRNLGIGGTSLLIMVGVALETVRQIESQMLMRHYKGFLE